MPKRYVEVDCFVHTSVLLEGEFNDWPANIQDGLAEALYRKGLEDGCTYKVKMAFAGKDIDEQPYIRCIAYAMRDT